MGQKVKNILRIWQCSSWTFAYKVKNTLCKNIHPNGITKKQKCPFYSPFVSYLFFWALMFYLVKILVESKLYKQVKMENLQRKLYYKVKKNSGNSHLSCLKTKIFFTPQPWWGAGFSAPRFQYSWIRPWYNGLRHQP